MAHSKRWASIRLKSEDCRSEPVYNSRRAGFHWLLLISAAVIFADRLTKTGSPPTSRSAEPFPSSPTCCASRHWTNEGAAFSLFADSASPHAVRWGLICFHGRGRTRPCSSR